MIYKPDEIINFDYNKDLGNPGEYPYTRGIYPTMYSGRLWTMRQYAGYGTAEESNKRYKYLLQHGQTGLSVAFDLPTQMGYDSSDPMALGEVGKTGVAIDTLADMEILFNGIPLDKVSTSMTINATASIILCMYIAVAEKQNISPAVLEGTVQNDILKEYIARGTYIFPPEPSMKLTIDLIEYCSKNLPKWNTISISGYHIREAGATAVQEIAFTFANAITYVSEAIKRGMDIDSFAPRLSFFFNCHNNFLEEVAKFRSARRLWARIMKDRFNAKNPKSWMLRFHTQTAGCTLTAQEPLNNAIRVAYQALAAVFGGTQSLHTNSYDEALGLPTEESVKLALRTQQVIGYETGIPEIIDPWGGSYAIEAMTNKIESEVNGYLEKIEKMGGAIKAIEQGYFQKEIHKSAYEYQKKVESSEIIILGVNKFKSCEETEQKILKVNPKVVQKQLRRLKKILNERDNNRVREMLDHLKSAAEKGENLMPFILDCVKNYATVGEITAELKKVYGEYKEQKIF
uniref:Methylmalonyl-CoA mutase n=1 Tax=candidate division WOR-3 bacterium TaxID=2052148 RepID=A0A7V0Z6D9_UNCW3